MATWYVYQNNVQTGPVSEDQLSGMGLTPATLVWREGMEQWQPAGQVPELSFLFEAPAGEGSSFTTTPPPSPGAEAYAGTRQYQCTRRSAISGRARRSAISECPRRILSTRRCLHTRLRQGQDHSRNPGHTPWFLRCAVFLSRQNRSRDTDYRALIRHLWYLESADIRTGHCHAHNVSGTV